MGGSFPFISLGLYFPCITPNLGRDGKFLVSKFATESYFNSGCAMSSADGLPIRLIVAIIS
jgi:hypothetical protein